MRRQLLPALGMVLVFTVVTIAYTFVVTGIAQVAFSDKADGSLIERDGQVIGSRWIGQPFEGEEYFHPRPSATSYSPGLPANVEGGPAYAAGSNLGPTNEDLLAGVDELVQAYREENGLADGEPVPVDAVTGSASSLDPHISVANARLQARRVAEARGLDIAAVLDLVDDHTDERDLGFLGEPGVNVLELNLALDDPRLMD